MFVLCWPRGIRVSRRAGSGGPPSSSRSSCVAGSCTSCSPGEPGPSPDIRDRTGIADRPTDVRTLCCSGRHCFPPNSFPGGVCEEGENPIEAALRETWEELGIKPGVIDVLGILTELPDGVTVSESCSHHGRFVCVVPLPSLPCVLQRRTRGRTHITPVMAHVMQDDVIDHLTINHSEVGAVSECISKRVKGVSLLFPSLGCLCILCICG